MADPVEQSARVDSASVRGLLTLSPVVAFVVAFTVLPVALLVGGGIVEEGGLSSIGAAVSDPATFRAIENSLVEGGVSALVAFAIGYPAGVFLGRNAFPGRSALLALLLVPFLLPTVAVVIGVEELFGPGGLLSTPLPLLHALGGGFGGIVAANVVFNAPIVVLLTVVGIEAASAELEETVASLGGGPARGFRDVWARPSLLGALAGSLLTFLFSALAFAGPILIGGAQWYTVEARIWYFDQILAAPGSAAVLAFVSLLLLALPTAVYLTIASRIRAGTSRRRTPPPAPGGGLVRGALGALTAVGVGVIALLLGLVVARAFLPSAPGRPDGSALATLFSPHVTGVLGLSTEAAIGNTLLFASLASAIALLLAIASAGGIARRPGLARTIGGLAFLPLLVSPVVLSFALALSWRGLLGGESSVAILIVVSQATLALPFALQGLSGSLRSVPAGPGEAARALGATPWQAYLDVELPAARAGVRAAALFAFALGLGEFTATNFLATPATTTLSVELYHLQSVRLFPEAQAIAGLLVLVSLATFLAIALSGGGSRADVF